MPTVTVSADDGTVAYVERVQAEDFETEHFRECIAERIGWATRDAQDQDGRDDDGVVPAG